MKPDPNDIQLIAIHWNFLQSELKISLSLLLFVALAGLIWLLIIRIPMLKRLFNNSDVVSLDIKLGKVGKISIKPNHEVRQIAHKAWVELVTRKAGVLVDKENDVVADVYASWYELFKEIRVLIREVPAQKLCNDDTKKLIDVLIRTLNEGLRPHLTQWQAKYKRWYTNAVAKDTKSALTPQDIQKKYKDYDALVTDMMKVNKQMIQYANELKKLLD